MTLVSTSIIKWAPLKGVCDLDVGHLKLFPFRRLKKSFYPTSVDGKYHDFLWMGTSSPEEWDQMKTLMAYRLANAAKSVEELTHAAATQVVFHECGAVFRKKRGKAGLEPIGTPMMLASELEQSQGLTVNEEEA